MVEKTRLNIGCGIDVRNGYINVDGYNYKDVDIVADILTCKFEPEQFIEILAKDVLEHLRFFEAKTLLRKCYEWLKPHGMIVLHVQNMPYLASQIANGGDYDNHFHFEVLKWIYGDSAAGDSGNFYRDHHWGYSKESIAKILQNIGFRVIDCHVDCEGFGLYVSAYKDSS